MTWFITLKNYGIIKFSISGATKWVDNYFSGNRNYSGLSLKYIFDKRYENGNDNIMMID